MRTQRARKVILPALAIVASVTLGGCQALAPTAEPGEPADTDTTSVPTNTDTETETGASDNAEGDTAPSLPDWTIGAPEANTDAYLAWEALMGPDGEYAALASYQAVLDEFGQVEPYATIKEAESRHAEALVRQLDRMGVDTPGENPYLGLIAAPVDLESAAQAWAIGEIANVELYDELIEQASDERLVGVFENLRNASADSHLPAFELAAENGGTLDPEDIPQRNQ
jgi:hypothetical protein